MRRVTGHDTDASSEDYLIDLSWCNRIIKKQWIDAGWTWPKMLVLLLLICQLYVSQRVSKWHSSL
jgi:hypothetical protein